MVALVALIAASAVIWSVAALVWAGAIRTVTGADARRPALLAANLSNLVIWAFVPSLIERDQARDEGASFAGLWPYVIGAGVAMLGVVALALAPVWGSSPRGVMQHDDPELATREGSPTEDRRGR